VDRLEDISDLIRKSQQCEKELTDTKGWLKKVDKKVEELAKQVHSLETKIQGDISEMNKNLAIMNTKIDSFLEICKIKDDYEDKITQTRKEDAQGFLNSRNFWITTSIALIAIVVVLLTRII